MKKSDLNKLDLDEFKKANELKGKRGVQTSVNITQDQFSFISFILTEHINKFSGEWNNDKLLVLVKK